MANDDPEGDGAHHGAGPSVAIGFVVGALVGAGIALLFAPEAGHKTRRRLVDAGKQWGDAARDTLAEGRETAGKLAEEAKSVIEAGRERLERDRKTDDSGPEGTGSRSG